MDKSGEAIKRIQSFFQIVVELDVNGVILPC